MRKLILLFSTLVAILVARHSGGQGTQAGSALSGSRKDSAGIRVVEHASIRAAPVIRILEPPVLELGGLQSDTALEFNTRSDYLHAVQLSSAEVVVADRSSVKMFSPSGGWLRRLGRAGQGPGEFAQIREVCAVSSDTIMVITAGQPAVDFFRASGQFIRRITVPSGRVAPDGCFGDGTFVHLSSARRPAGVPSSAAEGELTVSILNTSGTAVAQAGVFRSPPLNVRVPNTFNAVAYRQSIYMGDGRQPAILEHSRSGRLQRIIRWRDATESVSAEIAQRGAGGVAVGSTQRNPNPPPMPGAPRSAPAYSDIKLDQSGRIWVHAHAASRSPGRWTVFNADGSLAGAVELPESKKDATLLGFGRDGTILLRWIDGDGAYRITQHRLVMPRP